MLPGHLWFVYVQLWATVSITNLLLFFRETFISIFNASVLNIFTQMLRIDAWLLFIQQQFNGHSVYISYELYWPFQLTVSRLKTKILIGHIKIQRKYVNGFCFTNECMGSIMVNVNETHARMKQWRWVFIYKTQN